MLTFTPTATIVHLGLFREKTTLQPIEYYSRLPPTTLFDICYISRPGYRYWRHHSCRHRHDQGLGCQEYQNHLCECFKERAAVYSSNSSDVSIYVGLVDEVVGEKGEIVPAVGDAGDRLSIQSINNKSKKRLRYKNMKISKVHV